MVLPWPPGEISGWSPECREEEGRERWGGVSGSKVSLYTDGGYSISHLLGDHPQLPVGGRGDLISKCIPFLH